MTRVDSSLVNMRYGVFYHFAQMLFRFAMRTVLVKLLGDAFVGLNSLFAEVVTMLSLAEMGVGTAITFSLYKPLAENDTPHLARLMRLFERAYRMIALFVLCAGLALLPFVHLLVRETNFSLEYIRVVYLFFLINTASTYLFSYKSSLLVADQKNYKISQIDLLVNLGTLALQTVSLVVTRNFLVFLGVKIVGGVTRNLFVNYVANKQYPFLKEKAELPPKEERKSVLQHIRHTFIGSLAGKLNNSTDNILISIFDSTIMVGLCANYTLILYNVRALLYQLPTAASGGLGNMMVKESPERCLKILNRLTFILFVPAAILASCFYSQISPFIGWWLGAERILPEAVMTICVLNFLFHTISEPLWKVMNVSGLFAKDKNISIAGMCANVVVSILLGMKIGMLGILIGTFVTHSLQIVLKLRLLCKEKLHLSPARTYKLWAGFLVVSVLTAVAGRWLGTLFATKWTVVNILLRAGVSGIVTLGGIWLAFQKSDEWQYTTKLLIEKFSARFKKKTRASGTAAH